MRYAYCSLCRRWEKVWKEIGDLCAHCAEILATSE